MDQSTGPGVGAKDRQQFEDIDRPHDSIATLYEFLSYWRAESADVDVYMIDVTWLGIAAPHSTDLKEYSREDEISEHFPSIIQTDRCRSCPLFVLRRSPKEAGA